MPKRSGQNTRVPLVGKNAEQLLLKEAASIAIEPFEDEIFPIAERQQPSRSAALMMRPRVLRPNTPRLEPNTGKPTPPARLTFGLNISIPSTTPCVWKTEEIRERLRLIYRGIINEEFEDSSRELETLIGQSSYRTWSLTLRHELLKKRRGLDQLMDRTYRERQDFVCTCSGCRVNGPQLYRSVLCKGRGVEPIGESDFAFSEESISAFAYRWRRDPKRDLVSRLYLDFKEGHRDEETFELLAVLLLEFVLDFHSRFLRDIDLIVPVPPDPNRIRQRGFDPVADVFGLFSKLICIPMVEGLLKKDPSESCRSMSSQQRAVASRNVFSYVGDRSLSGLNVLLVDDVITTGNTIKNCARLLKNQGRAASVRVLSLFQAESSRKAEEIEQQSDEPGEFDEWDGGVPVTNLFGFYV
jgi:predicted amidophosphoribosyltransferase